MDGFMNDAIFNFLTRIIPRHQARILAVGSPMDFPFIAHLAPFCDELVYFKIGDGQKPDVARDFPDVLSKVRVMDGELESPEFIEGEFDLIFLYEVIYRMQELAKAVESYAGLLKPGGSMVAIEANWRCPYTFLVNLNDKSKRKLYTLWPRTFKKVFCCLDAASISMDCSVFHGGHSGPFFMIYSLMTKFSFLKKIFAPRYVIKGKRKT